MVLPDGLLTNASLQGVRDWLLERFKVWLWRRGRNSPSPTSARA